mgnify:CR=1 FL=1
MERVFLKPARDGLLIRDPNNRTTLPAEGAEVNLTRYYQRRINDGDVVIVQPAKSSKKSKGADA